jgi:hypothetical protein
VARAADTGATFGREVGRVEDRLLPAALHVGSAVAVARAAGSVRFFESAVSGVEARGVAPGTLILPSRPFLPHELQLGLQGFPTSLADVPLGRQQAVTVGISGEIDLDLEHPESEGHVIAIEPIGHVLHPTR